MTLKKHIFIALAAIMLLTGGAIASAQTTTDANGNIIDANGNVVSTTTTPGVPNTGAGGDAATNWAILAVTGIIVLAGVGYLARAPRSQSDLQ